ncbi:putative membrane protein YttA [Bacillus sp. THAF10]|uniref:sunset domain-containing protein n=1 Tax=Bacillus sp. THAF10 TaxID=2587848 RepID=UPI0012697177|nr:hypothetical protein [Bacillus sp. THAF10]QFT90429.1 putative membrane protein YttA [Bacillus sp. THAF10]
MVNKFLMMNGVLLSGLVGALITRIGSSNRGNSMSMEACKIKGNRNSRGELIYHIPGGRFYQVTKAVEWFDSEEAAISAGYRKSER